MENGLRKSADWQLLEETLDVYGADGARWPKDVRRRLEKLCVADADARQRLREEIAFEQLLNLHDTPAEHDFDAAADRIAQVVEGKTEEGRLPAVANAAVVDRAREPAAKFDRYRHRDVTRHHRSAPAAALLAASLMVGFFAGTGDAVTLIFQDVADTIGLSATFDVTQTMLLEDDSDLDGWDRP